MVGTYYDLSKFVLWGDGNVNDEAKSKPRLQVSFRDGLPRLTVYTGLDMPNGIITFPCDHATFFGILELWETVVKGEPGISYEVTSNTMKWENGERTNEKITVSTLHIGKNKDGVNFLAVIAQDRPKIVFPIKGADFHGFINSSDKSEIKPSVVSDLVTMGLIRSFRIIVSNMAVEYTKQDYSTGNRKVGLIKSLQKTPEKKGKIDDLSSEFDADIPF